jgi:LmbE family N-acetylglucosaminyl deacetylase
MKGVPVSEEAKAALRAKRHKQRMWVYGGLLVGLYAAWVWQPYEYDFIPRRPPVPNPPVDPDKAILLAKGTKILVVTAHPDDSEFYIGGTLTQLGKTAEIHQIVCTDGDKSYYGPFSDPVENRIVRRKEAELAMQTWGGKEVLFLAHPDGRLRANDELVNQIADAIRRIKPDYVIAFDGAFPPRFSHQDHRRSGDAALAAAKLTGIPKWCLLFSTIAANFTVDITDDWDKKQALLAIHKSQFSGSHLQKVTNMVAGLAEEDGDKAGVTLGEGFRCVRIRP